MASDAADGPRLIRDGFIPAERLGHPDGQSVALIRGWDKLRKWEVLAARSDEHGAVLMRW